MKILFLCGSIEPGKDGVGDYTRRLAGELLRQGHQAEVLSLCDKQSTGFVKEGQEVEGNLVVVRRISMASAYKQRLVWTQSILDTFQPEYISLQYVPYSFHSKGLPFWLPGFLKKLTGNHQWHIMFHELWVGIDKESSFKHRFIGQLQQKIVKRLLHNLKMNIIHTQSSHSQFVLKSKQINAELLPLFGNIPVNLVKEDGNTIFIELVIFGTIHEGAPFNNFVQNLINNTFKEDLLKLKFIFIGKNGVLLDEYIKILKSHNIKYTIMGIQTHQVISAVLLKGNWGISTTPYLQTEKSGVVAAYREHGLPVISVSRKWTPRIGSLMVPKNIIAFPIDEIKLDKNMLHRLDLKSISNDFIKSLIIL